MAKTATATKTVKTAKAAKPLKTVKPAKMAKSTKAAKAAKAAKVQAAKAPAPMPAVAAGGRWGKTPASQRRRQEIVAAAKRVFFEDGYQLAAMDRIAEAAGTTKRTVYDHFGNKDALFAECIRYGCALFVAQLPQPEVLSPDTADALASFTRLMASLINSQDSIRFQRMVIAEAERHAEFGQILYQAAFVAAADLLSTYLSQQIQRGRLRPHDTTTWSRMFIDLATSGDRTAALLAVDDAQDQRRAEKVRKEIIEMYVRTHRTGQASVLV